MFESDKETDAMVERLIAISDELGRGDVLLHSTVQAVVGCERHTGRWSVVTRWVRRHLLDARGIATWPVVNVGYKLLTHREQLERLPTLRLRKARSQMRRLAAEVGGLRDTELTPLQTRRRNFIVDGTRAQAKALAETERLFRALTAQPAPRARPAPAPAQEVG